MSSHNCRYFLKADHQIEWDEVTQEQFVRAERNAGFHPKPDCGPVATGGFSGRGMNGRIEYVTLSAKEAMHKVIMESD